MQESTRMARRTGRLQCQGTDSTLMVSVTGASTGRDNLIQSFSHFLFSLSLPFFEQCMGGHSVLRSNSKLHDNFGKMPSLLPPPPPSLSLSLCIEWNTPTKTRNRIRKMKGRTCHLFYPLSIRTDPRMSPSSWITFTAGC